MTMYGDKARIGLIIPSSNVTIEPEFNTMVPPDYSVHSTRLLYQYDARDMEGNLKEMARGTEEAARLLATAGVSAIAYGCTTGSLVGGAGWDERIIQRIRDATSISTTTTATAVIRVFRELGLKKVAVASPYSEAQNKMEQDFFEAHGITVTAIKGLDIHRENLRRLPPEAAYQLALEVNSPEAEAIFLSCTNFKTVTVISQLEKELAKPIFSSNTATMWDVLRILKYSGKLEGFGRLLEHRRAHGAGA